MIFIPLFLRRFPIHKRKSWKVACCVRKWWRIYQQNKGKRAEIILGNNNNKKKCSGRCRIIKHRRVTFQNDICTDFKHKYTVKLYREDTSTFAFTYHMRCLWWNYELMGTVLWKSTVSLNESIFKRNFYFFFFSKIT